VEKDLAIIYIRKTDIQYREFFKCNLYQSDYDAIGNAAAASFGSHLPSLPSNLIKETPTQLP